MKILLTLFVLFFSYSAFAEEFIFNCYSSESNFTTNWLIKIEQRHVEHIGALNNSDGTKYKGSGVEEIIFWNYPVVGAYSISIAGIPTIKVFNFKTETYNSSGFYDGASLPYSQLFSCYKSKI